MRGDELLLRRAGCEVCQEERRSRNAVFPRRRQGNRGAQRRRPDKVPLRRGRDNGLQGFSKLFLFRQGRAGQREVGAESRAKQRADRLCCERGRALRLRRLGQRDGDQPQKREDRRRGRCGVQPNPLEKPIFRRGKRILLHRRQILQPRNQKIR